MVVRGNNPDGKVSPKLKLTREASSGGWRFPIRFLGRVWSLLGAEEAGVHLVAIINSSELAHREAV